MSSRKLTKKSRKLKLNSEPTLNIVGISSCPYFINAKELSKNNKLKSYKKIVTSFYSSKYKKWLKKKKIQEGWSTSPMIWLEENNGINFIGGSDDFNEWVSNRKFSFNGSLIKYYLKGSCDFGKGKLKNLARIVKGFERNRSWTSALHYAQTSELVCEKQSFFFFFMQSGNFEYYIMILCKDEKVMIEIDLSKKQYLDQLIFHNVSVYNGDGALWTRQNSDKNSSVKLYDLNNNQVETKGYPELLYKKSKTNINKMEITGPVIIISRFYKPNSLLSTWVLNLGLLPKVFKNGREYKPADLESIKKLSNILEPEFEKRIVDITSKNLDDLSLEKLLRVRNNKKDIWRGSEPDHFFIPLDSKTEGLFPNIHSVYSFYHVPEGIDCVIIKLSFPKIPKNGSNGIKIIFADLMICDSETTSTEFTISSECTKCEYILVLKEDTPLPKNLNIRDMNSEKIHIARWRKGVKTPLLIYRLLHENCPSVDKFNKIKGLPQNFPSDKMEQRALYLLRDDLFKPTIVKMIN